MQRPLPPIATVRPAVRHYFPITTLRVEPGEPLPDFAATPNLAAFRGAPLLLNVFSVSCGPCIREVPKLNALHAANPDLQVLALCAEDADEAARFRRRHGLTWPVVAPGADYVYTRLGIEGIPAFLLLDADGRLLGSTYANQVADAQGYVTVDGLRAWVAALGGPRLR